MWNKFKVNDKGIRNLDVIDVVKNNVNDVVFLSLLLTLAVFYMFL